MHPAAWSAWVFLVMVVALATTNPLYLGIVLLSVLLSAVLSPRTGTGATSFRALLVFGAAMMVVSVVIATVNGSYGDHTLFVIPGPDLPNWLGGLRLGGPVTAEGLIWATVRGLVILPIFLAFGVFNGAVSPYRVLRSTPAALFHASLVVTVGLTLLPSSIDDLRRIREMRALRGAGGGLRDLPALIVPAVIGGLERSMRLAEAMEARGYASSPGAGRFSRIIAAASAPLLVAASWTWFYWENWRWLAAALAGAGAIALACWLWSASRSQVTTRFTEERVPRAERAGIAFSLLTIAATLVLRLTGTGALTYNAFAGVELPRFTATGAAIALACAWPALLLVFRPARVPSRKSAEAPLAQGAAP